MTIRAVGSASPATADRTSKIEDHANADRFAGMFSTAVHTSRQIEKARVKHAGTSELDRADAAENTAGTSGTAEAEEKKKKTARVRTAHRASATDVIKDVGALDPELQDKLARVMARMQNETGKQVTVGETVRTQDRQNALFAQGRETPGQVVTWTQNSKHTEGRAVDVTVSGGNAEAYQTLQRIANEEGLRTLGAIDPGHLELRGNGPKLDMNALIPAAPADANGQGQSASSIARVAEVARVADVAAPARLAEVARVAQPGQPAPVTAAPMTASAEVAANAAAVHAAAAKAGSNGGGGGGAAFGQRSDRDASDASGGDANGYGALSHGYSPREHAGSFAIPSAAAATGSNAAARAEQLMSLMDATPARQLSSLTMSVDNANGTSDRIHLAMRGASLDTTIATSDDRVAQLLSAKSDELSKALSKDGIELRELRVRAAADTTTVTAAATSHGAQSSGDASTQSRFDRGQSWQRQQDQQDQYDRQRSQQQQQQQRGRQQRQWRGDDR